VRFEIDLAATAAELVRLVDDAHRRPTGTIFDISSTLLLSMRKQPWLVRMPMPNFLFEPWIR
jgi:hypothetical protein